MPIVSYYHPNVTVGLVTDATVIALNKMPPVLSQRPFPSSLPTIRPLSGW